MFRKAVVLTVAVLLVLAVPVAGLAAVNGKAGNGRGPAGQPGEAGGWEQQAGVPEQVYAGENSPGNGAAVGLRQHVRQRLQVMLRTRECQDSEWQALRQELYQLKLQYRLQVREADRQEIRDRFQEAIRLAGELDKTGELEELLRELVSMEPGDQEAYRELGRLFRNRGEQTPRVFCNGQELRPDVPPVIRDGRTLIPIRPITEALGAQVQWDEKERTVSISKGETVIQLQVANRVALINGQPVELDVPADNISSRVFVPLRFVSQALQAEVGFYPEGRVITVNQAG